MKLLLLSWSPSSSSPVHALIILSVLSLAAATSGLLRCSAAAAVVSDDGQALVSIKSMVSDPLGNLTSWNHSQHYCNWYGVTCGGRRHPDRVRSLILDTFGLSGPIPPQIADLTFLRILSLSNNAFAGRIPPEFGKLSRLEVLDLSVNQIYGDIPIALTRCSKLWFLDLRANLLTGVIPQDIGLLKEMQSLNLGTNNLSGSIPVSTGNMTGLRELYLRENQLEGSIPETLGKLYSLQTIQLYSNALTGTIPSSLFNLSSLRELAMGQNLLEGTLPADMFDTLPNIEAALLFNNHLHGMIPPSLTNASKLQEFVIANCFFTGTVPSNLGNLRSLSILTLLNNQLEASKGSDWEFLTSLTNCTNLRALSLAKNVLGGSLPASISNLSSNLQLLTFGLNRIHGAIPSGIGNLVNLTGLDLSYNQLSGVIPDTIGRLAGLNMLELQGNNLSGPIPYSIGNLTNLNRLLLEMNNITGSMPESIGNCKSLELLHVYQNKITGSIPRELLSLPSLSAELDLSNNLFDGSLPMEVGNLRGLNYFNVSYNKLSGELPGTLSSCLSLEYLYLQHNLFQGSIPPLLSDLKGLRVLDVSYNNLSGRIPESLAKLNGLQNLNLSFNQFEGEVPGDGIFRNTSAIDLLGNKKLCGGSPAFHLPSCHMQPETRPHHSYAIKILVPILSGAMILIIISAIYISMRRMKKQRQISFPPSSVADKFVRVSYNELLKATNGFSISNLIGRGSFGSVYKGILSGVIVAVKVLDLQRIGASESFMAECEVLRRTRHRNLVQIITACSSIDSRGDEFKALVLKYMPNGSLENWLHQTGQETSATKCLSFIQRLNIAIDVAVVLNYLHEHGPVPIVHCDVKPSNVLLDEDMSACVSDFGISRFLQEKSSMMSENCSDSLAIRGTIGYVAPEYGMGGQISTNGDAYSYGILLLEMFTGKRATDNMFADGESLHNYVKTTPPAQVYNIVDPHMLLLMEDANEAQSIAEYKSNYMATVQDCIIWIFHIGLACSKDDPRDRMKMSEVVKQLHEIRNMLLKPHPHSHKNS